MNYYLWTYDGPMNETSQAIIGQDESGQTFGIPEDLGNIDYQAYLEWVAAGNTAGEWTPE
jgi:hypothetical protein